MSDEMKKRASSKEMRELYRKHNLCLRCGRKDARTMIGGAYCFDCIEADRERRATLIQNKQCTNCGKSDERTMQGRVFCTACNEKILTRSRRRYEKLRAERKCVVCGATDGRTIAGKWRCARCQPKRTPKLEIPRSEYAEHGLCYFCGAPVEEGFLAYDTLDRPLRVCEKHHQTIADSNKKWQTKRKVISMLRKPRLFADTEHGRAALDILEKRRFKLLDNIARQINEKLGCMEGDDEQRAD